MAESEINNENFENEEEDKLEEWVELKNHEDYLINVNYPYQIKKKSNNKIISEWFEYKGYIICCLNGKQYKKHRLIAEQFIENDDPENKTEIDHIDRHRDNNHISNLRWCSYSDNNKNKTNSTANTDIIYEYFDTIDNEAIEVNEYGKYTFEFYYYSEKDDAFYYYNGINYRKLHINILKKTETAFVYMNDTNNKQRRIYLNKFKKLYGIEF